MNSTDNMVIMGVEKTVLTLWKFGHGFFLNLTQVSPKHKAIALPPKKVLERLQIIWGAV